MTFTNGSMTSELSARCLCRGRWAGPKCELELHLSALSIHPKTISLHLQEVAPPPSTSNENSHRDPAGFHVTELTLFLWNTNSSHVCRLLQLWPDRVTDGKLRVEGLDRGQEYVACVANGHLDSCSFFTDNGREFPSKESNCVTLITPLHNHIILDRYIILVACVGLVFLLFLFGFFYLHRRTLVVQLCLHVLCCRRCRCCRSRWFNGKNDNAINRRMRKQLREVSGDVLMPDDIPVDFEEFEGENDLCSPMYSPDGFGFTESDTTLSDFKSTPHRPNSLGLKTMVPFQNPTDHDAFLYENQDLITPIYSPTDQNVMKLAFLEDDWVPANTGGQIINHERWECTNDTGFLTEPEDISSRRLSLGKGVRGLQGHPTLHGRFPLRKSCLSQPDVTKHSFFSSGALPTRFLPTTTRQSALHSYTMHRLRPSSFSAYSTKRPAFLPITPIYQEREPAHGVDMLHNTRDVSPFSIRSPTLPDCVSNRRDISPEIEYSDASGDYRYPALPDIQTVGGQKRKRLLRHSSMDYNVSYRHPKVSRSARYNRPLSMPTEHFLQTPTLAGLSFNAYPHLHPITRRDNPYIPARLGYFSNQNPPFPLIPRPNGLRYSANPDIIPDPIPWSHQQRERRFLPKQNTFDSAFLQPHPSPKSEEAFPMTNTLPRAKKPKFPKVHVAFDDATVVNPFSSHTLPRSTKCKPSARSEFARRPHQLSLRNQALDLSQRPRPPPLTFPALLDHPQNRLPRTENPPELFLSLPGSPTKPPSSKPVRTLISHFENNLFSRNSSKPNQNKSEIQEFIDLQSPLAEDRTRSSSRGRSSLKKRTRPISHRMYNRGGNQFTSLADDTYKCFFQTENSNPDRTKQKSHFPGTATLSSSFLTCDENSIRSETDADSALSKTASIFSSSARHPAIPRNTKHAQIPRSTSISCFAEDTVNLVTPFCTEDDSPKSEAGDDDTYNDVLSLQASSETLPTESHSGDGLLGKESLDENSLDKVGTELEPLRFVASPDFEADEPKEWEIML